MEFVGDTAHVLYAIVKGKGRVATFYGGGGQSGIVSTAFRFVCEKRLPTGNAPRIAGGVSIGTVNALTDVTRKTRRATGLWCRKFGSKAFVNNSLQALYNNKVLRISFLEKQLLARLCDLEFDHPDNQLWVGLTNCADGSFSLTQCDTQERELTIKKVVASCCMPGITRGVMNIGGTDYTDGSVGHPLPVQEFVAHTQPDALLVILPQGFDIGLRSDIKNAIEDWLLSTFCNVEKEGVRDKLKQRRKTFLQSLSWIRSQLALPLDHNDRVLPPTCLAASTHAISATEASPDRLRQALRSAKTDWETAFNAYA